MKSQAQDARHKVQGKSSLPVINLQSSLPHYEFG